RILHWNIHSWQDPAGAPNAEAVTALIRDTRPHVVSLGEVNEPWGAPDTLGRCSRHMRASSLRREVCVPEWLAVSAWAPASPAASSPGRPAAASDVRRARERAARQGLTRAAGPPPWTVQSRERSGLERQRAASNLFIGRSHSARSATAGLVRAAQVAGSIAPATAMRRAPRDSSARRDGGSTWLKLGGMPVWAVPAMAPTVPLVSRTAAAAAITAATMAGPAIQHTTMVSTWPGRMPRALKIPRSWTRSLAVISTVLSTP